ncbi:hypothetical protein MMC14_004809 [Varicellaria rhodocarpa]|nr:hypothetical protein [Varicellaria rhodocarpa]
MLFTLLTCASTGLLLASGSQARPLEARAENPLSDKSYGPIPGQTPYYSDYNGTALPFPFNVSTGAILPTSNGSAGLDDLLFQNLLQAEYVIFSFYQLGVDNYNTSSFVEAGFPENTYLRIVQIRDNEAGHARIFQDQISGASVIPGLCKYAFGTGMLTPTEYLLASTLLEISSMAFLTGLALQAQLDSSKAALLAIAETESRHNTWGLIDLWKQSPFAGPTDTVFPYANQILTTTRAFVIPGSCPKANPLFPTPNQALPTLSAAANSTTFTPGSPIKFAFPAAKPTFKAGQDYYAVYFHGLYNITVPYDPVTSESVIPSTFEPLGLILAVIADTPGAPTEDSVVAGPEFLFQQPVEINLLT